MRYDPLPDSPHPALAPQPGSRPDAPAESAPEGQRRSWWRRPWARWGLPPLATVLLGLLAGVVVAALIHIPQVESMADYTPAVITQVRAADGTPFASFARQRRVLLKEGEIPEVLQNAIIAVEDSNFFQHGGIDPQGILRAALTNLRHGTYKEGASTISMQLARQLYLTPEKTLRRKAEEAFTAVELEKRYSKQQLLTLYCNLVNVGHGNYGMEAAARYYFDKSVKDLTLPEAATLAGIPQRPSDYSPYRKPGVVLERRDKVLKRMHDEGYIGTVQYEEALAAPLGVIQHRPEHPLGAYFAEDVRKYLEDTYGTKTLLEEGLEVETTLDPAIQRSAEEALREGLLRLDHRRGWRGPLRNLGDGVDLASHELESWSEAEPLPGRWYQGIVLEADKRTARVKIGDRVFPLDAAGMEWTRRRQPSDLLAAGDVAWFHLAPAEEEGGEPRLELEQAPKLEGAVVVLESATGAVRAMVGGWDFERSEFNRVTQARRQVGSAFKPFVYGAALEAGMTPADTLFDAPTYFLGADNKPDYKPRNYYRQYLGILTLRRALAESVNMTSVKLLDIVGIEATVDFARRCGITAELPPYPSLALGVADISPLELAAAYAAVANQGTWVRPYLIERVRNARGRTLEEHAMESRAAMEPDVAYVLGHMLHGVVLHGTAAGKLRGLDLDMAGKTGTTNDYTDAWFAGFTPRYTILTWVGYDVKRSIGRGMTGAEAALPIWRGVIEAGLEGGWLTEDERFAPPPEGVTLVPVEYYTGLLPGPGAERLVEEAFLVGTEPVKTYEPRWGRILALPWYQQRPFYLPKAGERMPEDFADVARAEREREAAEASGADSD